MIKHYCDLGELVRRLGGTFAAARRLLMEVYAIWRDGVAILAAPAAGTHASNRSRGISG
jgi:hypothetical protein